MVVGPCRSQLQKAYSPSDIAPACPLAPLIAQGGGNPGFLFVAHPQNATQGPSSQCLHYVKWLPAQNDSGPSCDSLSSWEHGVASGQYHARSNSECVVAGLIDRLMAWPWGALSKFVCPPLEVCPPVSPRRSMYLSTAMSCAGHGRD